MILISLILSGITSTYRHYYILLLIIAKTFLQCCFLREKECRTLLNIRRGKFSHGVASPKKAPPPPPLHEEKIAKRLPLGEKAPPKD